MKAARNSMAEIFISYARSTAPQAQQIAQALRGLGYNVWRDDELPAHRSYAEVIEERLKAAKAVVVIWSAEAVKSEWVQSEADRARNDRKLVQLSVDGAPLPMPFDRIQCADLNGWKGDLAAPGWRKVIASIADLVGGQLPMGASSAQAGRAGMSICVLPFANMSNDPEQEYFADGISEDIITDLSKVSALAVVARNTAFTFKGKSVDIKQVARQIEVSHVLEGSVRKSGSKVRITAQLIDGASGNHVWAERYDRNLDDIFALQDEISEAIVSALRINLLPEEKEAIEHRGTANAEAYDLHLRARAFAGQGTREGYERAEELFRRANAIDPQWPEPLGNLVGTLVDHATFAPERREQLVKEAEAARNALIALFPGNHPIRQFGVGGAILSPLPHDYAPVVRAAEMAPQPVRTWAMAQATEQVCRLNEAADFTLELRRRDPLSLILSFVLQSRLDNAGRVGEAWTEYERSQDLQGNKGIVELLAFFRMQGRARSEIEAQYRKFLANRGPDLSEPHYDELLPLLSNAPAAKPILSRVLDDPATQGWAQLTWLSFLAAWFGFTDIALAAMRREQIELINPTHRYLWHPVHAEVRKDPRFKQLVRDLGLYNYWRKSGQWGDFARPVGDDDFEIIR